MYMYSYVIMFLLCCHVVLFILITYHQQVVSKIVKDLKYALEVQNVLDTNNHRIKGNRE